MEKTVWHSRIMRDYALGDKQGLAMKWFGSEWDPPTLILPIATSRELEALKRYQRGEPLPRDEFPEAAYVFDESRFRKVGDLLMVGAFYAVRGNLAEVLSRFDLGEGGLIPFPVFRSDKITPYPGDFFIWRFGAQKNGFLPNESPKIKPSGFGIYIEEGVWKTGFDLNDFDIAVCADAVSGPPDVWCDPKLSQSLFLSDALVAAIRAAKIKANFHLHRCRMI